MILKKLLWKKAVPAVLAGIAFFVSGCQPKAPIKREYMPGESTAELHQTAEDCLKRKQYPTALGLLNKIASDDPDYNKLPKVQYQIVKTLHLLGQYQLSSNAALEWLKTYPLNPEKKEVLMLLGENFEEMKNNPQAFYWFLEAKKEPFEDPQMKQELDERLDYLIQTSGLEDLDRIESFAAGAHYAPSIQLRRATVFLEQDELEKAKDLATSIVRNSRDPALILAGESLLARIQQEMAVKNTRVGCLLPLSGPFAIYGQEVLNGIQLGIFSANELEPSLELVVKDTRGDPDHALAGLEALVHDEKVMVVIGPLSSKTAFPVAGRAQELGVPMITLTQKEGITLEGDMVFRNFLTPSQEVKRVISTSLIDRGIRRYAILYPDNSYGRVFMDLFWDRVEEIGGTITSVESYPTHETDFADEIKKMTGVYFPKPASLVKKIREMRPPEEEESKIYTNMPEPFLDFDAVFIPDNYQRVAMIAPQLPYHDVQNVLLIGTSLWQSQKLVTTSKDYIQGAIFPSGFFSNSTEPVVKAFIASYKKNFGSPPGVLAAKGYDSIRLLQEVMKIEHFHTRKGMRNALFGFQGYRGVTGNIAFDPQGELQNDPLLLTISGRKIRLAQDESD